MQARLDDGALLGTEEVPEVESQEHGQEPALEARARVHAPRHLLTLLREPPELAPHLVDGEGLDRLQGGVGYRGAEELVVITGDDCVLRADCLERVAAAFARAPRIAVVFGSVGSAPFDPAQGFVPGCVIEHEFLARHLTDLHRMTGTTACMAIRRSVWERLGGFDEALGVGAPLRSAEDLDFALRALRAGYAVLQTPEVEVVHQTPVLWGARATVVRRNWYGTGAAMAKSVKLAGLPMVHGLARLVGRWVSGGSEVAATYGPKPDRVSMLAGFMTGFVVGMVRPVDRRKGMFR